MGRNIFYTPIRVFSTQIKLHYSMFDRKYVYAYAFDVSFLRSRFIWRLRVPMNFMCREYRQMVRRITMAMVIWK